MVLLSGTPLNVILAVRFNLASSPQFPFGLGANCVASFSGAVKRLYVTLLSGPSTPIMLHSGSGVGVNYSAGPNGTGTASTSPSVNSQTFNS